MACRTRKASCISELTVAEANAVLSGKRKLPDDVEPVPALRGARLRGRAWRACI